MGSRLVSLSPARATVPPGAALVLTVNLDCPSAVAFDVALSVTPLDAGLVPPAVSIAPGSISAAFTFQTSGVDAIATVAATLDATTVSSEISILSAASEPSRR